MEQRMSAWETRRNFGQVLRDVSAGRADIVVESHGEPIVAVIPFDRYQAMQQARSAAYDAIREVAQRVNLSDDEAAAVVAQVMRETGREPG